MSPITVALICLMLWLALIGFALVLAHAGRDE